MWCEALPENFCFKVRSRRPAQDPTNALLNMGYMTLLRELESHLEAHNLDPYLGVLHEKKNGRPSLALDILEEFRQGVIDLFVAKLINLRQMTTKDFQKTQDGTQMTEEGFYKFFDLYEKKMGQNDGVNPGLRKLLDDQVVSFKNHLLGKENYNNFHLVNINQD